MYTTPNMSLIGWDLETDPYDHTDLLNNWINVDRHDHTPGKGAPLPVAAIPVLDQANLGPCSVHTTQLCDTAVTSIKLASGAVANYHLQASSVSGDKVAPNAIGTTQLADGSVTNPKVAANAIDTGKIVDAAVSGIKIANNSVGEQKLANASVTTNKLADSSVTSPKIADQAVDTAELHAEAVTQAKIANKAVGTHQHDVVPMVYLALDRRQSIDPDDFHKVEWDFNRYDTDDMWDQGGDTSFIRIRTQGIYLIEACVMWEDGGPGAGSNGRRAKIRRNDTPLTGAGPITTLQEGTDAPFRVREPMVAVINCFDGDKIDLIVEQTSSNAQDLLPEGLNTHLTATWIAPNPS